MLVPALSELERLFIDEQSTLQQLQAILEVESSALLDQDILAIEGIAPNKVAALNAYQEQVKARLSFLLEHDFDGSEHGLLHLISSYPSDTHDALNVQWQSLKQGFEDVIMQNERNGIVIFHSQHRNRHLLDILHGGKNEPNLYNDSGAANGRHKRKSLGEA